MIAAANNNKKATIKMLFLLTFLHSERELHFQKHNLFNNNPSQFLCLEKKPDLEKGVSNGMVVARVHISS